MPPAGAGAGVRFPAALPAATAKGPLMPPPASPPLAVLMAAVLLAPAPARSSRRPKEGVEPRRSPRSRPCAVLRCGAAASSSSSSAAAKGAGRPLRSRIAGGWLLAMSCPVALRRRATLLSSPDAKQPALQLKLVRNCTSHVMSVRQSLRVQLRFTN